MSVSINGRRVTKLRPSSRRFTDEAIRQVAEEILMRQQRGIVTARDLAKSLNQDGISRPGGNPWNPTLLYHILRRGKDMGFQFVLRSRSEAAGLRRVIRRPKDVILVERAAQERAACTALQQTKTAITAGSNCASAVSAAA